MKMVLEGRFLPSCSVNEQCMPTTNKTNTKRKKRHNNKKATNQPTVALELEGSEPATPSVSSETHRK